MCQSTQAAPCRYLIVDDDEVLRERLAKALQRRGHQTATAPCADGAMAIARRLAPQRCIVDLRMPGASGLELVASLKALDATIEVVVLTGYGSIATAIEAIRLGASNYLPKPADVEDILAAFDRANAPPLSPSTADFRVPSLARAEWEHLSRVLADCGGNVSLAARRLGIHRRSLQRKLQKYPPPE